MDTTVVDNAVAFVEGLSITSPGGTYFTSNQNVYKVLKGWCK